MWAAILAAFGFTSGAYAYTNRSSAKAHERINALQSGLATKEDLKRVEDKVERLVDHFLEQKS